MGRVFEMIEAFDSTRGGVLQRCAGRISGLVLVLFLWFPYCVRNLMPLPFAAMLTVAVLIMFNASWSRPRTGTANAIVSFMVLAITGVIAFLVTVVSNSSSVNQEFFFLCLMPSLLYIRKGLLFRPYVRSAEVISTFVCLCIVVPMAVYERFMGVPIFADSLVQEGDSFRAQVGQLHSIILGLFIAASIVPLWKSSSRCIRITGSGLIVLGIVTTGAQGPAVSLLIGALLLVSRHVRKFASKHSLIITFLVAMLGWLLAAMYSDNYIAGNDARAYSTNYRGVLVAQVPKIISEYPFGFGFHKVPTNFLLAQSDLFGTVDLTRTVDSEFVIWTLGFGLLGAIAFFAILYLGLKNLAEVEYPAAILLLMFWVGGTTVAIYSFVNAGFFFAMMIAINFEIRMRSKSGNDRKISINSTVPAAIPSATRKTLDRIPDHDR